jgi:hypothetical protein
MRFNSGLRYQQPVRSKEGERSYKPHMGFDSLTGYPAEALDEVRAEARTPIKDQRASVVIALG